MAEMEKSHSADSSTDSSSENLKVRKSGHARRYAKLYSFFGFRRPYTFPLWVIFAGGMLGFSLSQLPDLHYDTIKEAGILPGDWYYFRKGHLRVGLIMHLATVLPAGIILILQFVPAIRQKLILFHRINGYIVILLLLASNVSVCVVLPHKQGGGSRIATQTSEVFLTIITTIGIVMAWINIRRKQIDQHRKWMLRTVFYYGTAVTSRVVTLITSQLISRGDNYDGVWSCDELDFLYTDLGEPFPEAEYPQCFSNGTLDRGLRVAVKATHLMTKPEQFATSNTQPFGASLWLCIAIHIIGVEFYLAMTPKESERLRQISYEKQLEAGFANPGSAGLPLDRFGDADRWTPPKQENIS